MKEEVKEQTKYRMKNIPGNRNQLERIPGELLIGQGGLHFSRRIAGKYGIARSSWCFPALVLLKIFKNNGESKKANEYRFEMVDRTFKLQLDFYLNMLETFKSRPSIQIRTVSLQNFNSSLIPGLVQLKSQIKRELQMGPSQGRCLLMINRLKIPYKQAFGRKNENPASIGRYSGRSIHPRVARTDFHISYKAGFQSNILKTSGDSPELSSARFLIHNNSLNANPFVISRDVDHTRARNTDFNYYPIAPEEKKTLVWGERFLEAQRQHQQIQTPKPKSQGMNQKIQIKNQVGSLFINSENTNREAKQFVNKILRRRFTGIPEAHGRASNLPRLVFKILTPVDWERSKFCTRYLESWPGLGRSNGGMDLTERNTLNQSRFMTRIARGSRLTGAYKEQSLLILTVKQPVHSSGFRTDHPGLVTNVFKTTTSGHSDRISPDLEGRLIQLQPDRTDYNLKVNLEKAGTQTPPNPNTMTGRIIEKGSIRLSHDRINREEQDNLSERVFNKHRITKSSEVLRDEENYSSSNRLNRINYKSREARILSFGDYQRGGRLNRFWNDSPDVGVAHRKPFTQLFHSSREVGEAKHSSNDTRLFSRELIHSRPLEKDNSTRAQTLTSSYGGLVHKKPVVTSETPDMGRKESLIRVNLANSVQNYVKPEQNPVKELSTLEAGKIADQVFKLLEKRIAIEKDRRGLL